MKSIGNYIGWVFFLVVTVNYGHAQKINSDKPKSQAGQMLVRIAEIEIYPEYTEAYIALLKEESEASVRLEPGVICIYPMQDKENPSQIRLLEIYADNDAYQSHLQTPHFKYYKSSTLQMVKSLQLIDMNSLDLETMPKLFLKMKP